MIVTLSVQQGDLHYTMMGPYDVVQNYHCQDKILSDLWSLEHGHQESSKVVGEDAECVLDDAPFLRQTIVKDSLIICHVVAGVWLIIHSRKGKMSSPITKCGMAVSSQGSGVGG